MSQTLLILVPGFNATALRNASIDALKDGVTNALENVTVSSSMRGASAGWRVARGDNSVDIHEAYWQDHVSLLSDHKLWIRVFTGLGMTLLWFNPRTLRVLRHSFMWLLFSAFGTLLLALWLYGSVAVLLVSIGNLLPKDLAMPPHFDVRTIEMSATNLGVKMQTLWLWAWLSVAVAAIGIKLDVIANLTDLGRRFMTDSSDDGVPIRTRLRHVVAHCVSGLSKDTDTQTIVVGHSFGVLLAMDAIANGLSREVEFISLGSFLAFLTAEFTRTSNDIAKCGSSTSLLRWRDFYSGDDWFAGPLPIPNGATKIQPSVKLTGHVPIYLRITPEAHGSYFSNPEAIGQIIEPLLA